MASSDLDSTLFRLTGQQYGIDPLLLQAVKQVETGGETDPSHAVSSQGAAGSMQLMPGTAAGVGVSDPTDDRQSIPGAARYLLEGFKATGSPEGAILYYHGGPNQAIWGPKTHAYLKKVEDAYQALKQAAQTGPTQASSRPSDDVMAATWGVQAPAAQGAPAPAQRPADADMAKAWGVGSPDAAKAAAPATPAPAPASPVAAAPTTSQAVAVDDLGRPVDMPSSMPEATQGGVNFFRGVSRGVRDVGDTLARPLLSAAQWVDQRVPGLAAVDQATGQTPAQKIANIDAARAAYDAQNGNSTAADIGRMVGQTAVTLPIMGAGNALLGAGADAARALPAVGPVADFIGGASSTGNRLVDYGSRLANAAGQGAEFGALTSGQSDKPVLDQAQNGALAGAAGRVAGDAGYQLGRYTVNLGRNALDFALGGEGAADRAARAIIDRFSGGPVQVNANQLVPGSAPTLAEATGNTGIARLQAGAAADPAVGGQFDARATSNASARVRALESAMGDEQALQHAIAARDNITPDFTNAQPISPAPIINAIDAELNGPGGKELALNAKLNALKGLLVDKDGNPIPQASDPAYLYQSVRKSIDNMMSGLDPNGKQGAQAANVMRVLTDLKRQTIDPTIESGAPGFQQYLADYSNASRPIDAMKFLQGLNITDAKGNITLQKVQTALDKIETANSARTKGLNVAQSVTPQQQQTLESIRDDLLRLRNATDGIKAVGSNTVQNAASQALLESAIPGPFANAAVRIPVRAAGAVLGGGLGYLTGGGGVGAAVGTGAGEAAGEVLRAISAARNQAARNRLAELLLNPSLFAQQPAPSRVGQYVINPLLSAAHYASPLGQPLATAVGNRLLNGGNAIGATP